MLQSRGGQSRWWNRSQNSSLLTSTSGYVYKWKFLTEHLLNINGRLRIPNRTRKILFLGRKQTDRQKGRIKKETSTPGGKLKVRSGSCTKKNHLMAGEVSWDKTATLGDHGGAQRTDSGRDPGKTSGMVWWVWGPKNETRSGIASWQSLRSQLELKAWDNIIRV